MKRTHLFSLLVIHSVLSTGGSSPSGAAPINWSRARLEQVARDFGQGLITDAIFKGTDERNLGTQLAQLQATTPETGELYQFVTFTLAYLGSDYQSNLQTLKKRPIDGWIKKDPEWRENYVVFLNVPGLLFRLYQHNHDRSILETIFSWQLDGYLATLLDNARIKLAIAEPLALLRTAQGAPKMVVGAVQALGSYAEEKEYHQAVVNLRRASRQQDRSLRQFADHLLLQMAAERRKERAHDRQVEAARQGRHPSKR